MAFLLCSGLLSGCPFFTADEQVDAPPARTPQTKGRQPQVGDAPPSPSVAASAPPARPLEQVTASHILIAYAGASRAAPSITRSRDEARARAEEVLAKARAGADFAELARQYSDGPSASRGGKLGSFPRGRMVPEFDKAVFGMQAGEVYGEAVETGFGFHVIYREK